jgi:hypothetical protein
VCRDWEVDTDRADRIDAAPYNNSREAETTTSRTSE